MSRYHMQAKLDNFLSLRQEHDLQLYYPLINIGQTIGPLSEIFSKGLTLLSLVIRTEMGERSMV